MSFGDRVRVLVCQMLPLCTLPGGVATAVVAVELMAASGRGHDLGAYTQLV